MEARGRRRWSSDVVVVAGAALADRPLEHGHARHPEQEERHDDRADDGVDADAGGRGDDPDAPPDAEVAEVVRVAGVAPEALVHDLVRVVRVGLEVRELHVAHGLEVDADRVEDDPDDLDRAQRVGLVRHRAHLHGQADDPHEDALQAEDDPQALQGELVAPLLAHGDVARILALPVVADEEVDRQPAAPEGDHAGQQQAAALSSVADRVADPGHEDEPRAPDDVDDGRVLQGERDEPGADHQNGDGQGAGSEDLQVVHAATASSVPRARSWSSIQSSMIRHFS